MAAPDRSPVDTTFEDLLERIEPRLKTVLARYRIPPEDAEDLLQQSLLAYLYKQDSVHDPAAWLTGTLRNRCLMYWRSRRRRLYEAVDTSILEGVAEPRRPSQENGDLSRDLEKVVARLPDRCRSLLQLRYRLGCEPPEAARRLGYSPSGIYKIMDRCLAALTRHLIACGFMGQGEDD